MRALIDPPSPFDPIGEWRSYLAELERIRPRTGDIERAIAEARDHIKAATSE